MKFHTSLAFISLVSTACSCSSRKKIKGSEVSLARMKDINETKQKPKNIDQNQQNLRKQTKSDAIHYRCC